MVIRITPAGLAQCVEPDPLPLWNRRWDGRWRLVTFDVPVEQRKDRQALWRALRARRFGLLQQSVWVWPHPIESILADIIQTKGIPECFAGFECARLFLCTNEELVRSAWDFAAICKAQQSYLQEAVRLQKTLRHAATLKSLGQCARQERLAYGAALEGDPFLPRALWPGGYQGEAVVAAHKKLRAELGARLKVLASGE